MNKINTVTVGIPIFNEQENIAFLLKSIIQQKVEGFILREIIVISDGSTDTTNEIVETFIKKYPFINFIVHKDQKGKAERLIEIYAKSKGDIIVTFDGDVAPGNTYVLKNITKYFNNPKTVLVAGNCMEVKATTFTGRLINTWNTVWYEAIKDAYSGDNVYNIRGKATAVRKSFIQKIKIDTSIHSSVKFLYFAVHQCKLGFQFAKDVIILYRAPENITDYLLQTKRSPHEWKKMSAIFGPWIYKKINIPTKYKVKALMKMIFRHPVLTPMSGIFLFLLHQLPFRKTIMLKVGVWKTVPSTKNAIKIQY